MAVNAWDIRCTCCEHQWTIIGYYSEFERLAIESRPCPDCGAYTLSSPEPSDTPKQKPARRPRLARLELATK